jgi:predicted RNase H-like nuclease (RuvC/YqgF family)
MIKINLQRSASFAGKDYPKGIHTVPVEVKKDKLYIMLTKDNMVQELKVGDSASIVDEEVKKLKAEIRELNADGAMANLKAENKALDTNLTVEKTENENLRKALGENVKTIEGLNKQIIKLKK